MNRTYEKPMMPKCSFGALQSLRIRMWLAMLLLLAGSMTGYAQTDCFEYEDTEETIINGLTSTGLAATSLTMTGTPSKASKLAVSPRSLASTSTRVRR